MKPEIKKLADDYLTAEQNLISALEELENGGEDCTCNDRHIIRTVFEGEIATNMSQDWLLDKKELKELKDLLNKEDK